MSKSLLAALQDDDEKALLVVGAAVALHGLLAGGAPAHLETVEAAFKISEAFQLEAVRRVGG
jgi:hypothetical protein